MALHRNLAAADGIHIIQSYEYADQAERLAASGFVAGDVGKVARQIDNNTWWLLVSITPITWTEIGVPSGSYVPVSRTITAGAGLIGGGDLSTDRTFDVVANADGSIVVNQNDIQVGILATDTQHGARGGGTQHAVATTSTAGFMSNTDKAKLDGLVYPSPTGAFWFGASGIGTTITPRYLLPGYTSGLASVTRAAVRAPRSGLLKNLRVQHNTVGSGGLITYTVRINDVDSTLQVTLLASESGGSDSAHTPSVTADDLVEVRVTKGSAIVTSPWTIIVSFEYS